MMTKNALLVLMIGEHPPREGFYTKSAKCYYRHAPSSEIRISVNEASILDASEFDDEGNRLNQEQTSVAPGDSFVLSGTTLYIVADEASVLTLIEHNAEGVLVNEQEFSVKTGDRIVVCNRTSYFDPTYDGDGNLICGKSPVNDPIDPPVDDAKSP